MFRRLEFVLQAVRTSEGFHWRVSDLHFRQIFVIGVVEYRWRKLSKETVGYWDSLDEKRIVTRIVVVQMEKRVHFWDIWEVT